MSLQLYKHMTDAPLTQQSAGIDLHDTLLRIVWFSNTGASHSIVHSHPYDELILVKSGDVIYSSDGTLYPVSAGEMIILPEGTYHSAQYGKSDESSERIVLQIDAAFINAVRESIAATLAHDNSSTEALAASEDIAISHHGSEGITIISKPDADTYDIQGLLDRIAQAEALPTYLKRMMYKAELSELLLLLYAIKSSPSSKQKTKSGSPLIKNVSDYIQMHFTDPDLTVDKLASVFYVTREHLSRSFKAYTLESVHNYITHLRMQNVLSSLERGKPVMLSATESGFSDYTSFVKSFKKLYGIAPSQYIKERGISTNA